MKKITLLLLLTLFTINSKAISFYNVPSNLFRLPLKVKVLENKKVIKNANKLEYDAIYRPNAKSLDKVVNQLTKISNAINVMYLIEKNTGTILAWYDAENISILKWNLEKNLQKAVFNGGKHNIYNIAPYVSNIKGDNILNESSKKYILVYTYASYFKSKYSKAINEGLKEIDTFRNKVDIIALNLDVKENKELNNLKLQLVY